MLVSGRYDSARETYTLKMTQVCAATPGQPVKEPYHIPIAVGLVGPDGKDMALQLDGEEKPHAKTRVLNLTERTQTFRFRNVAEKPVPSLLRGFTAPVTLSSNLKERDYVFLMANDSDPFNRWEAAQRYASGLLIANVEAIRTGGKRRRGTAFAEMIRKVLADKKLDPDFAAQMILLPSEQAIAQMIGKDVDVDAIHEARETLRIAIAADVRDDLKRIYERMKVDGPYSPDAEDAGRRALRNACLGYLAFLPDGSGVEMAAAHFDGADNMTDQIAALGVLANIDVQERTRALETFYEQWKGDHLVMDKWLSIQATSSLPRALDDVKSLLHHPAFTIRNPNKVRALITSFATANQVRFHAADGAGYALVAEKVLELDALNPQVAARLLGAFKSWRQFDRKRRSLMSRQLERIAGAEGISRDVYEIASKTLA